MSTSTNMRIWHRYLGYFLAGVMTIYAFSGVIMIFRNTNFLKSEKITEKTLPLPVNREEVGKQLNIREFKIEKTEGSTWVFKNGTLDTLTGKAVLKSMQLPKAIEALNKLHKATTKDPLFYFNIFFGASLLFFVVSSFFMFMPKTKIFRKGLWFALAGIVLVLIMLFV